jgi:hypothetical protein
MASEDDTIEAREVILSPLFSHTRAGDGCWRNIVWVYHNDPASPSGVSLAAGFEREIAEPILRELRATSPLSPTERR